MIERPSGKNSVVGIKPTVGLTPRDDVIPRSPRQSSVGRMARTVKDAAIILNAIAGKSPFDSATDRIP
jgi:amidase